MAFSGEQKAFCVLQFAKTQSIVTVQRGYVKDRVYVPPLPRDLPELRLRIMDAVTTIDVHMLEHVWQELDYMIDVCRVTKGGHIEHL
jgi:hypothetical protein